MRKRIVIGVLAIIAVAVLVYLVLQPKEGTVEWHKREYLDAWRRVNRKTLPERAKQLFERIAGRKTSPWHFTAEDNERMQVHRAALLTSGYLSQRQFDFTNDSRRAIGLSPAFRPAYKRSHQEFLIISTPDKTSLHVIAATEDMPLFVEAVREVEQQAREGAKPEVEQVRR